MCSPLVLCRRSTCSRIADARYQGRNSASNCGRRDQPASRLQPCVRGLVDQLKFDGRLRDTGVGLVFAVEEGEKEIVFWDNVTGEPLDTEGVLEAREKELELSRGKSEELEVSRVLPSIAKTRHAW